MRGRHSSVRDGSNMFFAFFFAPCPIAPCQQCFSALQFAICLQDGFYPEERGTFDRSTKQKVHWDLGILLGSSWKVRFSASKCCQK